LLPQAMTVDRRINKAECAETRKARELWRCCKEVFLPKGLSAAIRMPRTALTVNSDSYSISNDSIFKALMTVKQSPFLEFLCKLHTLQQVYG
jgi:hypothetical protein